ncbi:hypothetical protein [Streptomyces sp. NPDC059071]|uniref:hypothetical protein n=1 Tax=unclassified Streptomyces TaxID=2593676 RepID=UPI00362EB469
MKTPAARTARRRTALTVAAVTLVAGLTLTAKDLSDQIIKAQTAEIAHMRDMLHDS